MGHRGSTACAREREEGGLEEWVLMGRGPGLPGTLRSLEMIGTLEGSRTHNCLSTSAHQCSGGRAYKSYKESVGTQWWMGDGWPWLQSSVSIVLTM